MVRRHFSEVVGRDRAAPPQPRVCGYFPPGVHGLCSAPPRRRETDEAPGHFLLSLLPVREYPSSPSRLANRRSSTTRWPSRADSLSTVPFATVLQAVRALRHRSVRRSSGSPTELWPGRVIPKCIRRSGARPFPHVAGRAPGTPEPRRPPSCDEPLSLSHDPDLDNSRASHLYSDEDPLTLAISPVLFSAVAVISCLVSRPSRLASTRHLTPATRNRGGNASVFLMPGHAAPTPVHDTRRTSSSSSAFSALKRSGVCGLSKRASSQCDASSFITDSPSRRSASRVDSC